MKFVATILMGLFLASVGIGTAQAAAPSTVVLPKKATLLADGSVQITMKVRCEDRQNAFAWGVDISQGTISGIDSAGPEANLIPCDGKFHAVNALVPAANGPFTAGRADVHSLVLVFDPDEGDLELEDQGVVRLRP